MSSWWSRLPADLLEDLGSAPSTHMMAHNPGHSTSGGSDALFWLPQAPSTCVAHLYPCKQNTHTCKTQRSVLFFFLNRGIEGQDGGDRKWQLNLLSLDCVLKDLQKSNHQKQTMTPGVQLCPDNFTPSRHLYFSIYNALLFIFFLFYNFGFHLSRF